ncbi:UvrD-helicase domain-containing protein [Streptomyces longispororuber]|uniref:UvrD-helicase domain-containing protein n=1 Tax=Streptomyces longispororuber TaxID=68230 RepID=UPI0037004D48
MLNRPAAAHAELQDLSADLEVKAARRKWNPALHPRDSKGRFIETGGVVRLWGGKLARVVRALPHDRILVQDQSGPGEFKGPRHPTNAGWVSMVARPDGSAPTDDEGKVAAEDEKREKDPRRGNGVARDDDGDPDTPNEPHDTDDQGRPIGEDEGPGPDDDDDQDEPTPGKRPATGLPNKRHAAGARFKDTAAVRRHFTQLAAREGQGPQMAQFLRSVAGEDDLQTTADGRLAILRDDATGRWYLTATGTGQRMDLAGDFTTPKEAEEFVRHLDRTAPDDGFDFSDPDLDQAASTWRSSKGENIQAAIERARQEFDSTRPTPAGTAAGDAPRTVAARDLKPGDRIKVTVPQGDIEWPDSTRNKDKPSTVTVEGTLAPTYRPGAHAPVLDATLTGPDGTVLASGDSARIFRVPRQVAVSGHSDELRTQEVRANRVRVGDIIAHGVFGHVVTDVVRSSEGRIFTTRSLGSGREIDQFGTAPDEKLDVIPRARRRPQDVQRDVRTRTQQHPNSADAKRAAAAILKDWAAVHELAQKLWPNRAPEDFRALARQMQKVSGEPKGADGYHRNAEAMNGALAALEELDTAGLPRDMVEALNRLEGRLDDNADRFEADARAIREKKRKNAAQQRGQEPAGGPAPRGDGQAPAPDASQRTPSGSGKDSADASEPSEPLQFTWDQPERLVTLTLPEALADFLDEDGTPAKEEPDTRKALDEAKRSRGGTLKVTGPIEVHRRLLALSWPLAGGEDTDTDPREVRAYNNYAKRVDQAEAELRSRPQPGGDAPSGAPEASQGQDEENKPRAGAPGTPEPAPNTGEGTVRMSPDEVSEQLNAVRPEGSTAPSSMSNEEIRDEIVSLMEREMANGGDLTGVDRTRLQVLEAEEARRAGRKPKDVAKPKPKKPAEDAGGLFDVGQDKPKPMAADPANPLDRIDDEFGTPDMFAAAEGRDTSKLRPPQTRKPADFKPGDRFVDSAGRTHTVGEEKPLHTPRGRIRVVAEDGREHFLAPNTELRVLRPDENPPPVPDGDEPDSDDAPAPNPGAPQDPPPAPAPASEAEDDAPDAGAGAGAPQDEAPAPDGEAPQGDALDTDAPQDPPPTPSAPEKKVPDPEPQEETGDPEPVGDREPADMNEEEIADEIDALEDITHALEEATDPLELAYRLRAERRLWALQREEADRWERQPKYDADGNLVEPTRGEIVGDRAAGYGLNQDEARGAVSHVDELPPAKPGGYSDDEWKKIDAEASAAEDYPPTDEQRIIIEGAARRGLDMRVMALAGTGKSTTLKMLSRRMPGKRILYLAFNRSVADEAIEAQQRGEYAKNLTPTTANAYANSMVDDELLDRLKWPRLSDQQLADRMRWYGPVPAAGGSLSPRRAAHYANKLLSEWAKSDDDDFAVHHLPAELSNREGVFEAVKPLARQMWDNLTDPKAKNKDRDLPLSFDHTVKMWALSKRVPDTDVLFWDEAQDVNPVMEGIVRNIRASGVQIVAVGDSNQAIYGFRGATDALGRLPADATATLTQTFRFGDAVADAGNRFLRLVGSRMRLKGWDRKDSQISEIRPGDETMLIARTNAGVVLGAVEGLKAGRKVAVSGGLDDLRKFLEATDALREGKRTKHRELAQFNGMAWDDIREAVAADKALKQLDSMFKLMERHSQELDALLEAVRLPRPHVEDDGEHLWVKFQFGDSRFNPTKEWLKRQGFGYVGIAKRWGYPPPKGGNHVSEQERGRVLQRVEQYIAQQYTAPETSNGGQIVDQAVPHDLLVSTAHKAKGLESPRVRIAGDFTNRGPKQTPGGGIDWDTIPDDEDLRLAYVAVTRATDVLDTGSLGWIYDATRGDDPMEEPDGEYTRPWKISDFHEGDSVSFVSEDGETLNSGTVAAIDGTELRVRTEDGRTRSISPGQVVRRDGQGQPRLPVASPEELDKALADGTFVPPGREKTVRLPQDEVRDTLSRIRPEPADSQDTDSQGSGSPTGGTAPDPAPAPAPAPADEASTARMVADRLPELPPLPKLTGLSQQDKYSVRRIRDDYAQIRQSLDGILAGAPPTGDAREDLRRVRPQLDYVAGRLTRDLFPDSDQAQSARAALYDLGQDLDRALAALPEREPQPQGEGPNGGTLFHPWDVRDGDLVRFDAEDAASRNGSVAPYYGSFRGASPASGDHGRTLVTYQGRHWNEDRQQWEPDLSQFTVTMPSGGLVERFTEEQWDAWRRPERSEGQDETGPGTAPPPPTWDTAPADMTDDDITTELENLQAWQDRHVSANGEGPRVQGNLILALTPIASRREALWEEQRKRDLAREDRERKEKEKRERAAALARAEIGKRNEDGSYPVTVDGEDAGTVRQLARRWRYTNDDGERSWDDYKSRAEAIAALVYNRDVRRANRDRLAQQDQARQKTPDGWVLGDRADVAENDIIRTPVMRLDRDGRPYPVRWRQPVRVDHVARNDNGTMVMSVTNLDGSRSDISPVFLSHPDHTFAWASDRTRPEPTPAWKRELRPRMGDIADDIATLRTYSEGIDDPDRIKRLADLIRHVEDGNSENLQADLRRIVDETAWLEKQYVKPGLPHETWKVRSWAHAAHIKAQRVLADPQFQHGSTTEPDTEPPGDNRSSQARGLFSEGMNAVGGESLPEMQELDDRLGRADSAEDRDAELRDIADRMDALAEQYELAGPQGERAGERFRRAARIARGVQDGSAPRADAVPAGEGERAGDEAPGDDAGPTGGERRGGTDAGGEAADSDGGAAGPGDGAAGEGAGSGDPDEGDGGPDDAPRGQSQRRYRDVDSLRSGWRSGEGLTPEEATPERLAHLARLADREGLALSPDGGLAMWPEPQDDGSSVWRFAQARNGTNLPGITLTSHDPEEARALASRIEEITDANGDPFDWHQAWGGYSGPGGVAAWRDGEGRSLPQALRAVREDYDKERRGGFVLPKDLTTLSDPELEDAYRQGLGPEDELRVVAEMDRRDGYVDERIRTAVPDTPPADADEAEERGRAIDEALGFGDTNVMQPASSTPGRLRREFDALDEERFQAARQATGGRLLSPKAEADGIDPRSVFSGGKFSNKRARDLASPELRDWWDGNGGRLTYPQHRQREADRVLRDEFALVDDARYRQALEFTNGYFLRREYKYANLPFDELELFSGGSLSARERWKKYASEELQEWFDHNGGRLTFSQFKQQRRDDERRDREENEEQQPPGDVGADDTVAPAPESTSTRSAAPAAPSGRVQGPGDDDVVYDPATPRFANLQALREHIRSGRLDPPATADPRFEQPSLEERAEIADHKETRLSAGGRLMVYGNRDARRGADFNRRYFVAAPGSLTPVLSEAEEGVGSLKEALALANAVEERVRDADGAPFPWDAPDAAARARAFRTADGANLVDAIAEALGQPDTQKFDEWQHELDQAEDNRAWRRVAERWHSREEADGYTVLADPADLQIGDEITWPQLQEREAGKPRRFATARGTVAGRRSRPMMPTGIQGLGAADRYSYPATTTWTDRDGNVRDQSDTILRARLDLGVVRRRPRPGEVSRSEKEQGNAAKDEAVKDTPSSTGPDVAAAPPFNPAVIESEEDAAARFGGPERMKEFADRAELRPDGSSESVWLDGRQIGTLSNLYRSDPERAPVWDARPFFGLDQSRKSRSQSRDTAIANLVVRALQDGPVDPAAPSGDVWDTVKAHLAGRTRELPELPGPLRGDADARARYERLTGMVDAFRDQRSPSGDLREDLAQAREDFMWLRSALPDTQRGGEDRNVLADLDNRAFWAGRILEGLGSPDRDEERRRGGDEPQGDGDAPSPAEPTPQGARNTPEDSARPQPEPEPESAPEPVGGQPAHWARVQDLVPGDMVRITGTTKKGHATQRAGYVHTAPKLVDVTRHGRAEQMWRTWVTQNPDGTGASGNVYTSLNAAAARADAPDDIVPGSPESGAQAALRSGDLPDQIPADRRGRGLFPGSTVTGTNDREGTVTGATDTTVSVRWSTGNDEEAVSPSALTVTDSQRPDGWTTTGQRVTTRHIVSDTDGALLGPVDAIDGDTITITTADGSTTRSAGELRVTGEIRDDTPPAAPVTGIDEPAAADLSEGDVVLLDLDGALTAVTITSPPSRDGDRVTLQYADTTTGEAGELNVDARAVLPRAQGPDGGAPDLGPDDAPEPDENLVVHPAPQVADPVNGPATDPELTSSDRNVIGEHADGPDDDPDAHQAAVRITADLPVTPQQAAALAAQLRAAADPSTREGRAALRAADHLDRAAGRTPPAGLDRPRPSNAAQVGEGDLVAMPDERRGEQVHVFRVIDAEDGPGGVRSFLLEDENRQWRRRVVHGAMPVWQLPEAEPDPVTPPDTDDAPDAPSAPAAPDTPTAPVARARPGDLRVGDVIDAPVSRTGYQLNGHRRLTIISEPQHNGWWMQLTGMDEDGNVHDFGLHSGRAVNVYDRNRPTPALPPVGTPREPNQAPQSDVDRIVSDHARGLAARIIDEAIAGTQPPGDIHALREQVAQRLTAEALRDAREASRRDAAAALDGAGITGRDRADARRRLRQARNAAHRDTVKAALRTINDLEPLPGESEEDLAARARDLLRLIPDQVAQPRPTDPDADPELARAATGHAGDAVNALLQRLQAAGVDPGDAEQIARVLTQHMAGSRQATARRLAARIAAASPDAGEQPGLMAQIVALLIRMAKRLAELVKAAVRKIAEKYRTARERLARLRAFLGRMVRRVRQWPESRRLARLHRAVNLPDADGGTLAARISHWAGLLPEPGRLGQAQRRVTFWRPTTWGQLTAGRLPDRSDRIQWTPDRAADGGPGLTALRHLAALRAAGTDVDQDVTRRLAAALGEDFGDDPHATLQHADDYVAASERRLVNLQAARSSATIPDDPDLETEIDAARTELAAARREYADLRDRYAAAVPDAVAAALADIRDIGPAGNAALVFGPDTDPDAERAVRGVQRLIPRTWLNTPAARRLTAVDGTQGRYEPQGQRITVADLADDGLGTAGYALALHLSRHLGDLDAAQRAFWFSRTHTGRPGARRMRRSALDRLLRRWQTQPQTGDTLARAIQAMFSGDWYQDDDLRAFLLGLMATR